MQKEKVLGVIPARLNSTRLPRKMLQDICGKTIIEWTWLQANKASVLDEVIVATDSSEIQDVIERAGGKVIRTPENITTGSDRVAAAAELFEEFTPDIVLNIQGDEPMMPPEAIEMTTSLLLKDTDAVMSTVARPFPEGTDLSEPGQVKVVLDQTDYALYFSRSVIPYARTEYTKYYNHIGIYGYRANFLQTYVSLPQTPLEIAESLEQLRALEHGYKIKVGIGEFERIEVNEPHELEEARSRMAQKLKTDNL